jgi:hypothetical protein
MTAADKSTLPAEDPRDVATQLRPGLWHTINERYPGSMIRKDSFVPQARLTKSLAASRLTLVSSCGVHRKTDPPLPSVWRFPFPPRFFSREARRPDHSPVEVPSRRCGPRHQRHLSHRTPSRTFSGRDSGRTHAKFFQFYRLQHGPREI